MTKSFKCNGVQYNLIHSADGWYIHIQSLGIIQRIDNAPIVFYPRAVITKAKRIISEQEKQLNELGQCKY